MKMVKNVVFFVQSILCETKLSLYKTKRQIMSFINIWTSRFQNIRPLSIGPLSTISTCVPLKSDFFIIHMCFLKKFHISVFKENWTVTRTGQKVCRSLQSKFQKMLSFYLIRPAQNIKQDQVSPLSTTPLILKYDTIEQYEILKNLDTERANKLFDEIYE